MTILGARQEAFYSRAPIHGVRDSIALQQTRVEHLCTTMMLETVDAIDSPTAKSIPPQGPRSCERDATTSDGTIGDSFGDLCGGSGRCQRASSSLSEEG